MTTTERLNIAGPISEYSGEVGEKHLPTSINLICAVNDIQKHEQMIAASVDVLQRLQLTYFNNSSVQKVDVLSRPFNQLISNSDGTVVPPAAGWYFNNPEFSLYSPHKTSIVITDSPLQRTDTVMQAKNSPLAIINDGQLMIISFDCLRYKPDDLEAKVNAEYTAIELATRAFVYACGLQAKLKSTEKANYLYKYNCLSGSCILYEHSELLRLNRQLQLCYNCNFNLKNIVQKEQLG